MVVNLEKKPIILREIPLDYITGILFILHYAFVFGMLMKKQSDRIPAGFGMFLALLLIFILHNEVVPRVHYMIADSEGLSKVARPLGAKGIKNIKFFFRWSEVSRVEIHSFDRSLRRGIRIYLSRKRLFWRDSVFIPRNTDRLLELVDLLKEKGHLDKKSGSS